MLGDFFEDNRGASNERGGSGTQQRRLLDMPERDRPDEAESRAGRDDERGELQRQITSMQPQLALRKAV